MASCRICLQRNILGAIKGLNTTMRASSLCSQSYLKHQRRSVATWTPLASSFNVRANRKLDTSLHNVGLFEMSDMTSPEGFMQAQHRSLSDADDLVRQAIESPTSAEIVVLFDKLSDALCRVADPMDFIRIAHPDAAFCKAGENACLSISAAVEKLNTCQELHNSLRRLLDHPEVFPGMDEQSQIVGKLFMFDFEQSGIHLEEAKRKEFVRLNEEVLILGSQFIQETHTPNEIHTKYLPDHMKHLFSVDGGTLRIASLHSDSPNDLIREAAFKIFLFPNPDQDKRLNRMLEARHELATSVGFESYAHRTLGGTMAQTPENVMEFLTKTGDKLLERVSKEMEVMKDAKNKYNPSNSEIYPWDPSFYMEVAKHERYNVQGSEFKPYFSLGACMEGLNIIFSSLYGITLDAVDPLNGEIWAPDVQKLAVRHEKDGILGYIYCDFFDRPNKSSHDCHYTIRCGRRLDDGSYQIPRVVVNCCFNQPTAGVPTLLTHDNMENLFHEFGHAMHSMLARTRYQHVMGTRCSTDFAEVPSILMEYFANDYRVLRQFAKHYKTNETLPEDAINRLCASKKMFSAYDMQTQVIYSIIDQIYHSKWPLEKSTTDVLYDVQKRFSSLPPVNNTAWQLRNGHLVGYGAKYYSYLYSRAVAARVWHQVFAEDPFSRSAGERYRHEMLAHGGGREPGSLVANMLGKRPTTDDLVQSLLDETSKNN